MWAQLPLHWHGERRRPSGASPSGFQQMRHCACCLCGCWVVVGLGALVLQGLLCVFQGHKSARAERSSLSAQRVGCVGAAGAACVSKYTRARAAIIAVRAPHPQNAHRGHARAAAALSRRPSTASAALPITCIFHVRVPCNAVLVLGCAAFHRLARSRERPCSGVVSRFSCATLGNPSANVCDTSKYAPPTICVPIEERVLI